MSYQDLELIEIEKQKLRELERKHYETEQLLEACLVEDEDQLLERYQKEQEILDNQRIYFDNLEFEKLEVNFYFFVLLLLLSRRNLKGIAVMVFEL